MQNTIPNRPNKASVITGVLIADGWDDQFQITGMCIACDGEREIMVENPQDCPELFGLVGTMVRAAGTLERTASGEVLRVSTVEPAEFSGFRRKHGGRSEAGSKL